MPAWDVLALRYATTIRPARDLVLDADPHEAPGEIDYYIWVVRGPDFCLVVDTGYAPAEGARRGRTLLRHPVAALAAIGIDAGEVSDVVITHLHYDHAGNLPAFPKARFHLQDREMAYGTGRCMGHPRIRRPFFVEDVVEAVRMVYAGRVCFHDGDAELRPGITLHLVGGHSRGLQVVRVETSAGVVVVASDALHFAHYLTSGAAFPAFVDLPDVYDGYALLRRLAGPAGVILPGHDPCVRTQFAPLDARDPDILRIPPRSIAGA